MVPSGNKQRTSMARPHSDSRHLPPLTGRRCAPAFASSRQRLQTARSSIRLDQYHRAGDLPGTISKYPKAASDRARSGRSCSGRRPVTRLCTSAATVCLREGAAPIVGADLLKPERQGTAERLSFGSRNWPIGKHVADRLLEVERRVGRQMIAVRVEPPAVQHSALAI